MVDDEDGSLNLYLADKMEIYEEMMSDYHSDRMDRNAMLEQLNLEGLDEHGNIIDCNVDYPQWQSDNEQWLEEED